MGGGGKGLVPTRYGTACPGRPAPLAHHRRHAGTAGPCPPETHPVNAAATPAQQDAVASTPTITAAAHLSPPPTAAATPVLPRRPAPEVEKKGGD